MDLLRWPNEIISRSMERWRRLVDPAAYERQLLERRYEAIFGRLPDLDCPRRYTEKLFWLNLNYRNPLLQTCVDKFKVRQWVSDVAGANLLSPLLGVYESAEQINFDLLPEQFVLKVTSGSTWNIFCRDKQALDREQTRRQLCKWMDTSYFERYREWPYLNATPRIIAEPFMSDANFPDRSPPDWKFWCFNGRPRFVSICTDRRGDTRLDLFNCDDWTPMPFGFGHTPPSPVPIQRPAYFDEMLSVATKLAAGFPSMRVDLYHHHEQVIFGEMTVYPFAGYVPLQPESADEMIGDWLTLPTGQRVNRPQRAA